MWHGLIIWRKQEEAQLLRYGEQLVGKIQTECIFFVQLEPITQAKFSLQLMQEFEEIYGTHPPIHLLLPQVRLHENLDIPKCL